MKQCNKCGLTKPFSEFYRNSNRGDGYRGECIDCYKFHYKNHSAEVWSERKEKGGNMENRINLSTKVLRRFLKEDEFNALLAKYRENKLSGAGWSREIYLNSEVTDEEKELIKFYCVEVDKPLYDFSPDVKTNPGKFYGKVQRAAVKALAQILKTNPEILESL